MVANLIVRHADGVTEIECGQLLTLGRSKANDMPLRDTKISRQHALIRLLGDGKYYLMDMGSINGTSVNGERVLVPRVLSDGDEITMGDCVLSFMQPEGAEVDETDDDLQEDAPTMVSVGDVVQELTVLVADIRNYTRMSERIPVMQLSTVLSRWFGKANEIVESNGGVVDKFLGDVELPVLNNAGAVSRDAALEFATEQYDQFAEKCRIEAQQKADQHYIYDLKKSAEVLKHQRKKEKRKV